MATLQTIQQIIQEHITYHTLIHGDTLYLNTSQFHNNELNYIQFLTSYKIDLNHTKLIIEHPTKHHKHKQTIDLNNPNSIDQLLQLLK